MFIKVSGLVIFFVALSIVVVAGTQKEFVNNFWVMFPMFCTAMCGLAMLITVLQRIAAICAVGSLSIFTMAMLGIL
jgi:hypothetical protein